MKIKALLTALIIILTIGTAQARPTTSNYTAGYRMGYHIGYGDGKSHAYNNVARTFAIVGAAIVISVVVYELGKESRWTANENGVVYRF